MWDRIQNGPGAASTRHDEAAHPAALRPRLVVFAITGDGLDAARLAAALAHCVGDAGTVACWAGEPALRGTANASRPPASVGDTRLHVAVASNRALVFAAAHRQLHGSAAIASLTALDDAAQLRACLNSEPPQALLIDEVLLQALDPAVAHRLRDLHTIVLCDAAPSCTAECVLARGLRGCLALDAPPRAWEKAIAAVRRGELWLPRAALQQAATTWPPRRPEPVALAGLTPREAQTVELLREGLSNKQIARRLGVCEDTVKKHLQHAFAKLGVHRRALVALGRLDRP